MQLLNAGYFSKARRFSVISLQIGWSTGDRESGQCDVHIAHECRGGQYVGTGLTFDEYVELKLNPRAGADLVFFQAAEQKGAACFRCRSSSLPVSSTCEVSLPAEKTACSRGQVPAMTLNPAIARYLFSQV
jgi:hypothetical protein